MLWIHSVWGHAWIPRDPGWDNFRIPPGGVFSISTKLSETDQMGLHFHLENKADVACGTLEWKYKKGVGFCEVCEKLGSVSCTGIYGKVQTVWSLRKVSKVRKVWVWSKSYQYFIWFSKVWCIWSIFVDFPKVMWVLKNVTKVRKSYFPTKWSFCSTKQSKRWCAEYCIKSNGTLMEFWSFHDSGTFRTFL